VVTPLTTLSAVKTIFSVAGQTLTGTLTSSSPSVTGLASTVGLSIGQPVSGTGIPSGTTIAAITSATAITLSANATASGAATLTFGDTANDNLFAQYITQASQAICTYCQVDDFGLHVVTELKSGCNDTALVLRQIPVQSLSYTGNTTNGSPVVTALSSTAGLFPYQTVFQGAGNPATTIVSVDSATQITLAKACTANLTASPIAFGVALWKDDNALAGAAPGAFAAATLLTEGADYWVDYAAGPGSPSKSGLVYRVNSYWARPGAYVSGLITPQPGPPVQNIKVSYPMGFATIPADLAMACEMLIAKARRTRLYGQAVQSISYEGSTTSLSAQEWLGLLSAEITCLLSNYKIIPY
jgi:hypothetical protein